MILTSRLFLDMISYFVNFFERQPGIISTVPTVGRASTEPNDTNSRADVHVLKVLMNTNDGFKTYYISFRFTIPSSNRPSQFSSIEILKPNDSGLESLAKLKPNDLTLQNLSSYYRLVEEKFLEILNGGI
jgi:hypothetical protein